MILGIQTAQKPNGLALVTPDGHPLATLSCDAGRLFGDTIVEQAQTLCTQAGANLTDLTAIGVVTGPGGYTAVRVGVALANSLAQAVGCPVYGMDTLTALAHPYCTIPGTAVVITPTIGSQVAVQLLGFHDNTINPLTPIDVAETPDLVQTLARITGKLFVIGTLPEPIKTLENPALIRIHTLPDARVVAQWAAHRLKANTPSHAWVSAYYAYDAVPASKR